MKKGRLIFPEGAIKISLPAMLDYNPRRAVRPNPVGKKKPAAGLVLQNNLLHQIPDGSIYVDAPDLPQPTNYSCALAAASIARMYGVGPDSMDEFMEGMKTKRSGTSPQNIAAYLNTLGLDARIKRKMSKEDLMDLLDEEISTIVDIQAYASDPKDYDDPSINHNGHYIAAIGYSSSAPQLAGQPRKRIRLAPSTVGEAKEELYFYFMDPSILCRYGYLPWTELDRRWHDDEGTRKKPRPTWHMGIVIRPNGHKPIHNSVAELIV